MPLITGAYADDQFLTLVDMEKISDSPLDKGVKLALLEYSNMMNEVHWETIHALDTRWLRQDSNFGRASWTNVGAKARQTKSAYKEASEVLFHLSFDINVPKQLVKNKNLRINPRTTQTQGAMRGTAALISTNFVYGNPDLPVGQDDNGVDVFEAAGIDYRQRNAAKFGLDSGLVVDCGGLDISKGGISSGAGNQLFRSWDDLIETMGGEGAGVILLDRSFKSALGDVTRRAGGFASTKDSVGRTITSYNGWMVKTMGQRDPTFDWSDRTNRVIQFQNADGTANAAAGSYMPFFFIRFGPEQYHGLQQDPLEVEDVGLLQDNRTYRTTFDWSVGYKCETAYCVARGFGVKVV